MEGLLIEVALCRSASTDTLVKASECYFFVILCITMS